MGLSMVSNLMKFFERNVRLLKSLKIRKTTIRETLSLEKRRKTSISVSCPTEGHQTGILLVIHNIGKEQGKHPLSSGLLDTTDTIFGKKWNYPI